MFVEFVPADGSEPYKRRVGRSRFLVRARTRGGHVTHDDVTLSIEPYYTFKAKNPSLHLEIFDAAGHAHLRRQLSTARAVTARDARPSGCGWSVSALQGAGHRYALLPLHARHHPEIDAYYVIDPESPECRNLEGLGHVLATAPRSISRRRCRPSGSSARITRTSCTPCAPAVPPRGGRREGVPAARRHGHQVDGAQLRQEVSGFETDLVLRQLGAREGVHRRRLRVRPQGSRGHRASPASTRCSPTTFRSTGQFLVMPTWRDWLLDPGLFIASEYYQRW